MLDKEIRNSLVLFLKEKNQNIKVFNEVKINSSIADLMIVSDKIRGYEIKSDGDDYYRLSRQIKNYNRFFDENYVVVGKTHKESIKHNVPDNWGIICIDETGVAIYREAKQTKIDITYDQLNFLWDIELKEILLENDLSLCPNKDKQFIIDYIHNELTENEIQKSIIKELLKRDETFFQQNDCFLGNEDELVNLLSSNDITLDYWISIFTEANKLKEQRYKRIKEIDKTEFNVDCKNIDIDFNLGSPFIKPYIIDEFIFYLAKDVCDKITFYDVSTGVWTLHKDKLSDNSQINYVYGLPSYNALKIIESILNNREIKAYKIILKKKVVDEQVTITLLDKAKIINAEFKKWVYSRQDLLRSIKRQYNKLLLLPKKEPIDWQSLVFNNINKDFSLFDYQKEAVARIIANDNTLVAFDVGSGKTAIMVAAAMKMREENISRKNMFVVPNSIVGQWEKMFTDIYPDARVLTISPKDFTPAKRSKVITMIKENDYDGIVIAYSCFEQIPLSADYQITQLNSAITSLSNDIQPLEFLQSKTDYLNIIKKIRLMIEDLKTETVQQSSELCFDKLGINTLFIDEAHNYKNLPIETSMKNLLGFNLKGSPKCKDMLDKVRCIQKQNSGRGVVFATGTPLSNSIADAYNMQLYLQPELMAKCNIVRFDDWIKTFSILEESFELDVTGLGYKSVQKFNKFINLDTLSNIFSQTVIYYAKKDFDKLPLFKGYTDIIIEKNDGLSDYMKSLAERAEKIRLGQVNKKIDNMLKVSTDGRKAALDLRLVKFDAESGDRLKQCANNVLKIYKEDNYSTQIIFSDFSTPKDTFNVYDELKNMLVKGGVEKEQIVFIHNYENEIKRVKLFSDINNSIIRIIIGSTFKLGIGVNIQKHLKAIHHLDVPWRPADMIQREGRIIRPGNEQSEISIYRYITKGSFDGYSWQLLENKQRFITEFLSGTGYQKQMRDLEENVLGYAEAKALALEEPLIKEIAETENEIARIVILKKQTEEQRMMSIEELKKLDEDISIIKQKIIYFDNIKKCTDYRTIYDKNIESFRLKVENTPPVEIEPDKYYYDCELFTGIFLYYTGVYGPFVWKGKKYCKLIYDFYSVKVCFPIELGDSISGNVTRINNFFKNMNKTQHKLREELFEDTEKKNFLMTETKKSTDYDISLIELNEKLINLRDLLEQRTKMKREKI